MAKAYSGSKLPCIKTALKKHLNYIRYLQHFQPYDTDNGTPEMWRHRFAWFFVVKISHLKKEQIL